jgi:hydrogenase maturation protease
LVRLEGKEVAPAVATRLSPHQVGVADLLDGARWLGQYPRRLVLLGVVPESMDLILGLSATVRPALPALVESIVEEASRLGFEFRRLPANETLFPIGTVDVARLAGMR